MQKGLVSTDNIDTSPLYIFVFIYPLSRYYQHLVITM